MALSKSAAPTAGLAAFVQQRLAVESPTLQKLVTAAERHLGRPLQPSEQAVLSDAFKAKAGAHDGLGAAALVGELTKATTSQAHAWFGKHQASSADALFGVGATAKQQKVYAEANAKLVGKYPTLDVVLKDPDAFIASVKTRFAEQRSVDPAHPYRFDFSDYGLPVLKGFEKDLGAELEKVRSQLERLPKGDTAAIAEHELGIHHLQTLKAEVAGHLKGGKIDYERLQELSYFSARAMGHFDEGDLSLKDRAFLVVDRFLQGHKHVTMAEEVKLFESRQMTIFEANPGVGSGFRKVQKPFVDAFANTSELKLISLPTSEPLGTDVFMRLAQYDLFLMGVTQEPVAADGFVRPGSDFYVHDARHNSAIFGKRLAYEAEHRMTEPQIRQLQKQIDVWRAELADKLAEVKDPQLKSAIEFFEFNFHHDRGFPMVPSSYEVKKNDYVPKLLYAMLKASGQDGGANFDAPSKTLAKAFDFLRTFWLERLPQEQAILNAKGLGAPTDPSQL